MYSMAVVSWARSDFVVLMNRPFLLGLGDFWGGRPGLRRSTAPYQPGTNHVEAGLVWNWNAREKMRDRYLPRYLRFYSVLNSSTFCILPILTYLTYTP